MKCPTIDFTAISRVVAAAGFAIASMPCRSLAGAETAPRPNFLVILTDDVGWGDHSCYNPAGKIATPNVDRLAREGMRFTHAHAPAALCAPTRYSMLTGNYPWRGRAARGTWGFNVPSAFLPGQQTIANLLEQAGYRTAMLGKSGIGGQHAMVDGEPDFSRPMIDGPKRWGFGYSFIIPLGHQNQPYLFLENEQPVRPLERLAARRGGKPGYAERGWDPSAVGSRLLECAEKFLDQVVALNRESGENTPFYLYVSTDGANIPYEPAKEIRGVPLKGQTKLTPRADMVLETDVLLGQLREMLERRGLWEDTLICVTSDNGGIPTERHLRHDSVGGLRGVKSYITEGGHRVPFIVSWPRRIPVGVVRNQVVGIHDIVPTTLELAGVNWAHDQCLDAVSLVPVLLGRQDDSRPVRASLLVQATDGGGPFDDGGIKGGPLTDSEPVIAHEDELFVASRRPNPPNRSGSDGMAHALLVGEWKLTMGLDDQPAALYHLVPDPTERNNLIAEPAERARLQQLTALYREIRASRRSVPASAVP